MFFFAWWVTRGTCQHFIDKIVDQLIMTLFSKLVHKKVCWWFYLDDIWMAWAHIFYCGVTEVHFRSSHHTNSADMYY